MTPERKVLQTSQAAERIGLSVKTLKRWRHEGVGPAYIVLSARRIGYYEDVLADWLAKREVHPAEKTI